MARPFSLLLLLGLSLACASPLCHALDPAPFMRRALELAQGQPRAPFGAVIVNITTQPPMIVAEGVNAAGNDPTKHGEIMAIQDLAQRLGNRSMAPLAPDLALLTTAEPCSMCMSAILWARFGAVYYGASIPYLAEHGWAQIDLRATQVADAAGKGLPQHVEIYDGILQSECEALYSRGPPAAP